MILDTENYRQLLADRSKQERLLWAIAGYCEREIEEDASPTCCEGHLRYILTMARSLDNTQEAST